MDSTPFHQLFANALTNTSIDCDTFVALNDADESKSGHGDSGNQSQRRFDIYRNNRAMSLIEVLASTYPALVKLLGTEFFNAAARAFIDVTPPKQPVMAEYGHEFGAFIASLPNTEKLPFLTDVAAIEWHKLQAYHCEDIPVLLLTDLAEIEPEALMDSQLQTHPSLSCISSQWPVGSIWTICTDTSGNAPPASSVDMSQPETIIITRPQLDVQVNRIDSAAANRSTIDL